MAKKSLYDYTKDEVNSMTSKELLDILVNQIGQYTGTLREWARASDAEKEDVGDEQRKYYEELERIRNLFYQCLIERLKQ